MTSKRPVPRSRWARATFLVMVPLSLAWQLPSPAGAEEISTVDQAAVHHERGIVLFEAGEYAAAAAEFESAERLAHSRANLNNLALCFQQLGEHARALEHLDRYLAEPGLPADARERAAQVRVELVAALAAPEPDAEAPLDEGAPPATSTTPRPSLAGPWALLASGLGVLLIGGVLDAVAYVRSGEHDFADQSEYEDWYDQTWNLALAGDLLVGVGAAAAVGGLIWLLVNRARSRDDQARRRGAVVSMSPGPGGGLVVTTGTSF